MRALEGDINLANRLSIMQDSIAGSIYSHNDHESMSIVDTTPGMKATSTDNQTADTSQSNLRHPVIRAFEEELNSSWVYQNSRRRRARARPFSIGSSAQLTQTWSLLSGLTLSGISNLSVLALPIQKEDLVNSEIYWSENREDFDPSSTKESRSTVGENLYQLPEIQEQEPMFEQFEEEPQDPDKKPEVSRLHLPYQSQNSPTMSVSDVENAITEEFPVLFIAASLFELHFASRSVSHRYAWLDYSAGEVSSTMILDKKFTKRRPLDF